MDSFARAAGSDDPIAGGADRCGHRHGALATRGAALSMSAEPWFSATGLHPCSASLDQHSERDAEPEHRGDDERCISECVCAFHGHRSSLPRPVASLGRAIRIVRVSIGSVSTWAIVCAAVSSLMRNPPRRSRCRTPDRNRGVRSRARCIPRGCRAPGSRRARRRRGCACGRESRAAAGSAR